MTNPSSLDTFCDWLKDTGFSLTLQSVEWIIPLVQTVHILAIAAVVGAAITLSLRVLRAKGRPQPGTRVASTPFLAIWVALPILLVTGALLVIAEPARDLENPVFALKMGLVLVAVAVTFVQQAWLRRTTGDGGPVRRLLQSTLAVGSLALWAAIILAGRLIAYIQSF